MSGRATHILLVEDNPGDARLIAEAFRETGAASHLSHVDNGSEALDYLRRHGGHARATRPDLILLDLNLPRKDGREVLAEIKGDASLRHIPVVVLTTCHAEDEVCRAYNLNANCFITKPADLEQFTHLVRSLHEFWFKVAHLPASVS